MVYFSFGLYDFIFINGKFNMIILEYSTIFYKSLPKNINKINPEHNDMTTAV